LEIQVDGLVWMLWTRTVLCH